MKNKFNKKSLGLPLVLFLAIPLSALHAEGGTAYPADNTGLNARDKNLKTLTPQNQSTSKMDVTLTQRIRKSLQEDTLLSMNAKNIKIITVAGKVTLRGPVASEAERVRVCEKAKEAAGLENVADHLEVVSK